MELHVAGSQETVADALEMGKRNDG